MAIIRTPLRYPGGKSSLASFLHQVFKDNSLTDITYVEPFAGGAGAAISLLLEKKVSSIVLNDLNPSIYNFWSAILNQTDGFISKLRSTPISIGEWKKQKNIFINPQSESMLDVGFATFYLNRCNHSGILTANPIGGINQTGKWKINARYNKEALEKKIINIAEYKDKITISNADAISFVKNFSCHNRKIFIYLDPPYFKKGNQLYLNAFNEKSHIDLCNSLKLMNEVNWMLTYDDADEIVNLYKDWCNIKKFSLNYFAFKARIGAELLMHSQSLRLPHGGVRVQYGLSPHHYRAVPLLPDTSLQLA